MKTTQRGKGRKRGSAMVVVMCLAAILMIVTASLHTISTNLAYTVVNLHRGSQALAIAEAGIEDALQKLANDYDAYKISIVSNSVAGGTYVVNISTNGKTGAILRSTGMFENATRLTIIESLGLWQTGWNTNTFGEWGIFAKGIVDMNGEGQLHASCFSGTTVEIAPGCTVDGSINSVGGVTLSPGATVGGTVNSNVAVQPTPTFDFNWYSNYCLTHGGQYFDGNQTWNTDIPDPPSHILCVRGEVKILNGAIVRGAIVATGDIIMTGGQILHVPYATDDGQALPSLMSIGGSVKVCGGQTLNGFVYAAGNVELNGGDTVYGGVIAGGIVDGRNKWTVYPGPGKVPPGINPTDAGVVTEVRIGGWLQ